MDKLLDSLDQWEDVPEHIKTLLTKARAAGSSANPQVGASVQGYPSSDSESSNYSHDSTSSKDEHPDSADEKGKSAGSASGVEVKAQSRSKTESIAPEVYTADDYFAKKTNPAKKKFRHVLRMAAVEAKVYGKLTFKETDVTQRHWIIKRVTDECPVLKGHQQKVHEALSLSLIQAKQYLKRKDKMEGKKDKDENKQEEQARGSKNKQEDEMQKGHKPEQKDGDEKHGSEQKDRGELKDGGEKKDGGKRKSGSERKDGRKKKDRSVMEKQKDGGKQKDGKQQNKDDEERKNEDDKEYERQKERKRKHCGELSEYEMKRQRNIRTMQAVLSAAMNTDTSSSSSGGLNAGDDVVVLNKDVDLATGYFIRNVDDLYAEIILCEHLNKMDDVNLPETVPVEGGNPKMMFSELERNDKFLWKREKIRLVSEGNTAGTSIATRKTSRERMPPERLY